MPPIPLYLRWEHTTPPHRKFYELEVELSLFFPKRLTRRWGRLGTRRPRTLHQWVEDPHDLQTHVAQVTRRRQRHGYRQVLTQYLPVLKGVAA